MKAGKCMAENEGPKMSPYGISAIDDAGPRL